jgi:hypothetical protein
MNPKPLAGMLTDDLLEDGVEPTGIGGGVAGYIK